jgi:hypothetical protein
MDGFHWDTDENNAIVGWYWDNPTDARREADQMLQQDYEQYLKDADEC